MSNTDSFIKGLKQGFTLFGEIITTAVNFLLLSIVFIIGVGVTSVISKVIRKRFLQIKFDKDQKTYWQTLDLDKKPIKEYYRQF